MDCTNCEYSKELEKLKAEVDHLKEEIGPEKPPCGSDCTCDDCDILKKCPKYKDRLDCVIAYYISKSEKDENKIVNLTVALMSLIALCGGLAAGLIHTLVFGG